jgi:hypothetical protein
MVLPCAPSRLSRGPNAPSNPGAPPWPRHYHGPWPCPCRLQSPRCVRLVWRSPRRPFILDPLEDPSDPHPPPQPWREWEAGPKRRFYPFPHISPWNPPSASRRTECLSVTTVGRGPGAPRPHYPCTHSGVVRPRGGALGRRKWGSATLPEPSLAGCTAHSITSGPAHQHEPSTHFAAWDGHTMARPAPRHHMQTAPSAGGPNMAHAPCPEMRPVPRQSDPQHHLIAHSRSQRPSGDGRPSGRCRGAGVGSPSSRLRKSIGRHPHTWNFHQWNFQEAAGCREGVRAIW